MLAMFGISALFHRVRWSAPAWRRMRRADHSAIFVGIAGTSTGVAGLALSGWSQPSCSAWSGPGAIAGIVLRQVWLDAPQWAVAVPYVVVGWCSLIVAPQLVRSLGWVGFALMLVAGVAYTAGALIYARKRPDPWPGVFGFHEVFHACTVIGAGRSPTSSPSSRCRVTESDRGVELYMPALDASGLPADEPFRDVDYMWSSVRGWPCRIPMRRAMTSSALCAKCPAGPGGDEVTEEEPFGERTARRLVLRSAFQRRGERHQCGQ
jgi:hemolysin III